MKQMEMCKHQTEYKNEINERKKITKVHSHTKSEEIYLDWAKHSTEAHRVTTRRMVAPPSLRWSQAVSGEGEGLLLPSVLTSSPPRAFPNDPLEGGKGVRLTVQQVPDGGGASYPADAPYGCPPCDGALGFAAGPPYDTCSRHLGVGAALESCFSEHSRNCLSLSLSLANNPPRAFVKVEKSMGGSGSVQKTTVHCEGRGWWSSLAPPLLGAKKNHHNSHHGLGFTPDVLQQFWGVPFRPATC